jgi:Rgg/GadR/MutR family transcriptional activator
MMTYGEAFRYFRHSKGLTLKQVADQMNSVSLIGQFETNQCHISIERFVHLLDQIGVTYDEFQLKRQGTTRSPIRQKIHEYRKMSSIETVIAAHGQHISAQDLFARPDKLAAENSHHYNLQLAQQVQLDSFYQTQQDRDSQNYPKGIQYYLTQVDDWGLYELNLFKECIRAFPVDVSWRLLHNVGKKVQLMADLPGYASEICNVYFSAITGFIVRHDLAKAWQTWRLAKLFCETEDDAESALRLPAMAGWITLHEGHEDKARALFNETLHYFQLLHFQKAYNHWHEIIEGQITAYHQQIPQYFVFVTPYE